MWDDRENIWRIRCKITHSIIVVAEKKRRTIRLRPFHTHTPYQPLGFALVFAGVRLLACSAQALSAARNWEKPRRRLDCGPFLCVPHTYLSCQIWEKLHCRDSLLLPTRMLPACLPAPTCTHSSSSIYSGCFRSDHEPTLSPGQPVK